MGVIYFLVGILATTVGAISGLGGGVIIKPVLDMLGHYDISTIGVLSSLTVFSMAVVSLGKSIKNKVKLDGIRTASLAIGSIVGGTLGKEVFSVFLEIVNNDVLATKIQSSILFLLMFVVLVLYLNDEKIKAIKESKKLKNSKIVNTANIDAQMEDVYISQENTIDYKEVLVCTIWGFNLGIVASFLGIGGGPLNVIVLMYLLNMNAKQSAIHSIFIIFFSQGSKIVSVFLNEGFGAYNLDVSIYMIIGGISGGFLGSYLSTKMNKGNIKKIFTYCMILIMFFNLYNIVK